MQFGTYAGASFAIALLTVYHAWSTRIQYYPTVVFLTTNKIAQVALGNWGLVMTLATGKLVRTVFLGTLRDIEVEVMYENARFAITETCLALTVFRSDISAGTIVFFTALLFVKAFHWLAQARVEHLEQAGPQSFTSMARLSCLMLLNLAVDGWMVEYCAARVTFERPSVLILFSFEFAILSIMGMSSMVKFILYVIDSNMAGAWHGKTMWTLLLEFFSEVFRFVFYVIFFVVMVTVYSVPPLHLIRDIYMSFAQIQRRLQAFYRYRQLALNMDQRFPDATEAELQECERTCIICRDAMEAGKKLPCSHIFHFQCLRLWLQQQQACPTCRANIPTEDVATAGAAAADRARAEQGAVAQPAPLPADRANGVGEPPRPVAGMQRIPPGAAELVPVPGVPNAAGNQDPNHVGGLPVGGVNINADAFGLRTIGGDGAGNGGIPGLTGQGGDAGAGMMGGGEVGAAMPPGMAVYAVIVTAEGGAEVRKHVERDSPRLRTEDCGAVLLLLGPQMPCGSYCVFGGWVGGPGRDNDVRLVDIAQEQPPEAEHLVNFPGMPVIPPGVDGATGGGGPGDESNVPPGVEAIGENLDGGDGLRRRVVAGDGSNYS